MAGQGLVGLGGAAGASEGFETLLTRRLLEQKQAEEERSNQAQDLYRQQNLEEQKRYRESQVAEAERSHTENERARRISLALMQPVGAFSPSSAIDPMLKDYPELSGFFDYAPQESKESRDEQGNYTETVRPAGYRFRGKEADKLKAESLKATEEERRRQDEDRDLNRLTRLSIAQLMANSGVVPVQDPDTGQTHYVRRTDAPGQQAPQPGATRERINAYNTTLDMVDDIMALGNEIGWTGLGGMGAGSAKRFAKQAFGVGGDKQEALRDRLDRLRAQASFQEGGKQFTGTEAQLLANFLANVNSNPRTAVIRLKEFRDQANKSLSNLGVNRSNAGQVAPIMPGGAGGRGAGPGPGPSAGGRGGAPPVRVLKIEPPGSF